MTELLQVNNAMCRIGRHKVLSIESFRIEQGQHWCLFGPNGAGKTLLANLIAAKRIESGKYVTHCSNFVPIRDIHIVSFEEQQNLWQKDNRLDISEYSEDAHDTGTQVIELIRSTRASGHQDSELLEQLSSELDISHLHTKGIRFLSSGQIRKVLIARALYAFNPDSPQVVILDDPLESIDGDSQERIKSCIDKYLHSGFSSIQLCRRKIDVLPSVSHIALMQDLKILQQGDRAKIEASDTFRQLQNRIPMIPDQLPNSSIEPNKKKREVLIELSQINASYGPLVVLNNLSWAMYSDQHVQIEGPNGCGKSTLLSLIDGENHKAYGQDVTLFGTKKGSGETIWEVKAKFGVVSNELHNKYVKGWKVIDVIVSGFFDSVGLYDDSGAQEIEIAKDWLGVLDIVGLEKYFYHEISFGQQRLVLLARATVKQPRILVLDEPCVGLDDFHRVLMLGVLDKIAEQTATSIVYVSHIRDEKPQCINRRLSFVSDNNGGFRVEESVV